MVVINGVEIRSSLEELIHPQHTALLIYDMQVGIVRQINDGGTVFRNVLSLLEAARNAHVRTIFTRHMSLPPEFLGAFGYRMAMAWQRKTNPAEVTAPFRRNSHNFQLAPELEVRPSEVIFDKLAMSAFEGTPLEFTLRNCGIRSLIIAGIALEIGIEPTCRHAADLGIIPILVQDACGAGDAEAAGHCVAALQHMGDTIVTDLQTVTAWLRASASLQPDMHPKRKT